MKHAAPLSNEQKNIWPTHVHHASVPLFNASYLFRAEGKVDLAVLTQAIHHVVARHGGLTSRFGEMGGASVQLPAPKGALDLVRQRRRARWSTRSWPPGADDPAHRSFWRGVTPSSPALPVRVPGRAPNPAIEFRMSPALSAGVQQAARQHKTTLKALLVSMLQPGLTRALDRSAFSLAIVMNGRKDVLSDPLHSLGLFWNILSLPLHMASFEQRLADNHRHLVEMDKFSAFPLHQASAAGAAEPAVTFNFVKLHNRTEYGGGALRLLSKHGHDHFHYPLNIFVALERGSGEIYVKIESDAACVELALAQRVLDDFADALNQVAVGAAQLLVENA